MKITEKDEKYYCVCCGSWVYNLHKDSNGMELCAKCSGYKIKRNINYELQRQITIGGSMIIIIVLAGAFWSIFKGPLF